MAWRFYDFDANWDKVYEVWQGNAVQDVLQPDMEEFLEKEPQIVHRDEDGQLRRPTWHRGNSLWRYSASCYPHGESMMEAANTLANTEKVFEQLLAALKRHGLDFTNREEELLQSEIYNRAFNECERRCEPKEGTLESRIFFGGEEVLQDAQLVLATQLFPEEQIAVAEPAGPRVYRYPHVLLCKQRLVFDFHAYWYHKRHGASSACPQFNVSDLVGT